MKNLKGAILLVLTILFGQLSHADEKTLTGLRYCINSASLKFISKVKLKDSGYGKYVKLFEKKK